MMTAPNEILTILKEMQEKTGIAYDSIPLDDAKTLEALSGKFQLNCFEDYVKFMGICDGTGEYYDNIVKADKIDFEDLMIFREEICGKLIEYGHSKNEAFEMSEKVRRGKGLIEEQYKKMKESDVPQWFVKACKTILYAPSKIYCTEKALLSYRLTYYKLHL